MRDFDHEKEFMLPTVNNDRTVYADAYLRLPDIVFDRGLRLDLGGRVVEIHHFGHGNTPGDTVVYAPEARVAWTGNLIVGAGFIPPVFEGRTGEYLQTIALLSKTLDVQTIIPGHGAPADRAVLGRYLAYLNELIGAVGESIAAGRTLEETLAAVPLPQEYAPTPDSPFAQLGAFLEGLHRLNVQQTYRDLSGR